MSCVYAAYDVHEDEDGITTFKVQKSRMILML